MNIYNFKHYPFCRRIKDLVFCKVLLIIVFFTFFQILNAKNQLVNLINPSTNFSSTLEIKVSGQISSLQNLFPSTSTGAFSFYLTSERKASLIDNTFDG